MKNSSNIAFCGIVIFLNILLMGQTLHAVEYHVSLKGSDTSSGGKSCPFRTIQHASDVMHAGDICIVHKGTYREWIKPPRGGDSDEKRITYKAARNEEVIIKGSEQISSWTRQDGIWQAEIPDSFFGNKNPFKRNIEGEWLFFGSEYHLGDVYLNGTSLKEKLSLSDVINIPGSWYVEVAEGKVILYANFGNANPNKELTEINVRESVFFPEAKGLKYITVDGFTFAQAAPQWAYWNAFEEAAVSTYFGYRWIIQNCRFTDVRCVALVCGNDPCSQDEGQDINNVGRHIIRRNSFTRCGEAAIHGNWGWAGSLIEANLIEDINTKNEFGGMETAGIKIHYAVDVTVKNNVVRRIFGRDQKVERPVKYKGYSFECVGIWIDWGAQGTRVTGNVVYDSDAWAVFIQNSNGSPILVDNNIFQGIVRLNSQGVVYAHNMFADTRWIISKGAKGPYWRPHSGKLAGVTDNLAVNEKWWNNLFINNGANTFPQGEGFSSDWNVFYGGAAKSKWGDAHSLVDSFDPNIKFTTLPNGVEVALEVNETMTEVETPLITPEVAGIFSLTGQSIEDADGNPIILNQDIHGKKRKSVNPTVGPIENISKKINSIRIYAGI